MHADTPCPRTHWAFPTAPFSPSRRSRSCYIMAVRLDPTKTQQTNSLTSGDRRRNKRNHSPVCSWNAVRLSYQRSSRKSRSWIWSSGGVVRLSVHTSKRFALCQSRLTFSGLFCDIICCYEQEFKGQFRFITTSHHFHCLMIMLFSH